MSNSKILVLFFFCLTLTNCNTETRKYPIDKRYWTNMDYADAITQLKYGVNPDEKLPTFDDPKTRIIVEKLTDQQNFKIVLEDNELGLKHRNKVATDFFNRWKDLNSVYRSTDRKDNYIYSKEMIEIYHFGLGLQLIYFKLGNDEIIESADDPNSSSVKSSINSNVTILIRNYLNYLDEINDEKALSDEGKELLAQGIDIYFTQLVESYPNADYSGMINKVELMEKKSKSEKVKSSLGKLKVLIESKKATT